MTDRNPIVCLIVLIALVLMCAARAKAEEFINDVVPAGMQPDFTYRWERSQGMRRDFDDQLPWHGCVYDGNNDNVEAALAKSHLADVLAASGHFDEAAEEASAAVKLRPDDYDYRLFRAKLNFRRGLSDLAREDLRIVATRKFPGLDRNYAVETLLVRLGEYKLAADTIPTILPTIPKYCVENEACFQYLLADCQDHLGNSTDAMQNYARAARTFLTRRAFGAGRDCLEHIQKISARAGAKVEGIDDLVKFVRTETGVAELKAMVAQLVSDPNCLKVPSAERITHCTLIGFRKDLYQTQPSKPVDGSVATPLTGISGVQLDLIPTKMELLRINLDPMSCELHFSDLKEILSKCPETNSCPAWVLNGTNWRYKIPSGILVVSALSGPLGPITLIDVIDGDEKKLARTASELTYERQSRRNGVGYDIISGKVLEALAITKDWVSEQPGNPDAQCMRAKALAATGQYEEAIKCLDVVIAYARTAADGRRFSDEYRGNTTLIEKGVYQTKMGKYAEAMQSFTDGFPKDLDSDHYWDRACAEIGLGQLDKACTDLQTAENMYCHAARIVRRDETRQLLAETERKMVPALPRK